MMQPNYVSQATRMKPRAPEHERYASTEIAMPEPTTASTSISWLSTLTPVVTFVLGFVSAVFAEPARQRLFRPVLRLSYSGADDCVARTPTADGSEAIYIRVKVTNEKPRLARACRAYLVSVETKSVASGFVSTLYADSIQLAWSCQVPGSQHSPLDIPNGVSQYIDVIATTKRTNTFAPQISFVPFRYNQLFSTKSETYRLTIQVSGDGVEPKVLKLIFVWKGQWDTAEAYEDMSEA